MMCRVLMKRCWSQLLVCLVETEREKIKKKLCRSLKHCILYFNLIFFLFLASLFSYFKLKSYYASNYIFTPQSLFAEFFFFVSLHKRILLKARGILWNGDSRNYGIHGMFVCCDRSFVAMKTPWYPLQSRIGISQWLVF